MPTCSIPPPLSLSLSLIVANYLLHLIGINFPHHELVEETGKEIADCSAHFLNFFNGESEHLRVDGETEDGHEVDVQAGQDSQHFQLYPGFLASIIATTMAGRVLARKTNNSSRGDF